jgi:O-antigen biosynthesis protein
MHDTAAAFGAAFFRSYVDAIERPRILEIGAGDVNGSLRGCAPFAAQYTGVDLEGGPGVDLVLADPYAYPSDAESFDAVVSSSCFEHDPMFWLTFAEMCRVVRSGGFIYLNAPSNGWFHRHPTDNWRFYPDAGLALAQWGRRNGYDIRLIESLVGRRQRDVWNDCVMVFGKGETQPPVRPLAALFPCSFNVRMGEVQDFRNYSDRTEDMRLQDWLAEKLKIIPDTGPPPGTASIGGLIATLAEREVALAAVERGAVERTAAAEARVAEEARLRTEAEQRAAHAEARVAEEARLRTEAEQRAAHAENRLAEDTRLRSEAKERASQAEKRLAQEARLRTNTEQGTAQAERRLAEAEERLAAQGTQITNLAARAAQVEAERDSIRREYDSVRGSTFWLLTGPARRAAAMLPAGLRRQGRRSARVVYWFMTPHRTRERIAYFRSRSAKSAITAAHHRGSDSDSPDVRPLEPAIVPPPINPVALDQPGEVTVRTAALLAEIPWQPRPAQTQAGMDRATAKYQAAKLGMVLSDAGGLASELQAAISVSPADEAGDTSVDSLIRAAGIAPLSEPSMEPQEHFLLPILRRYREAQIATGQQLRLDRRNVGNSEGTITISILMPVYKIPIIYIERALLSVVCQTYPNWELCIVDDGSEDARITAVLDYYQTLDHRIHVAHISKNAGISTATNLALEMAAGSYIGLIDCDDMLGSSALEEIAHRIAADPRVDFLYTDECKIDENDIVQQLMPKPDWSPLLLTAFMYTGHFSVYRTSLARQLGGMRSQYDYSQDYDLALRVADLNPKVAHIRGYHYGWRMISGSASLGEKPHARASNIAALQDAMDRRGWGGIATALPMANRVLRTFNSDTPLVSIVIPTGGNIPMLKKCLAGIFTSTDYRNFEVIILDNTESNVTVFPHLKAISRNPRISLIEAKGPFNFSRTCNLGARAARGDVVVFLNDDVVVISPDWIQSLLECIVIPGVGAVGPKLLYENNGIQHAGMVTGTRRLVGTAFHTFPSSTPANLNLAQSVREVSLISAACLAMRKSVFNEVGGFDEINTPREHSDVDLCFRIRELGYSCVYTPHAELTHVGHVSMGAEEAKREIHTKGKHDIYLLKRLGSYIADDPYFPQPMRDILYVDSQEEFRLYPRYQPSTAEGRREPVLATSQADQPAVAGEPTAALDILIFSHDLTESGAPRAAFNVARTLRDAGHFVVVASPSDGPYRERLRNIGVDVIVDEVLLTQDHNVFDFARNFDKVICNTIVCWRVVAQLNEVVDVYWYVHESEIIRHFVENVPGFAAVLKGSVPIWADSRLAAKFLRMQGVDPQIIEYGIDDLSDLQSAPRGDAGKVVIGMFGSYEPRKGQDLAVNGMLSLSQEERDRAELRLFGRTLDVRFRDDIEETAGGDSSIVFFGEVDHDECLRQMVACDIILVPSRDDALSFVALDALSLGKALVCSKTTGVSEYLQDGWSGLIVHNNTPEEISRVLALVIADPELRVALGKRARGVYERTFSMPSFTGKLHAALGLARPRIEERDRPPGVLSDDVKNDEDFRFWQESSHDDLCFKVADLHRQRRELYERMGAVEVEGVRRAIAHVYLSGHGIEVGAGTRPVPIPEHATVRYGDIRDDATLLQYFAAVKDHQIPGGAFIDAQALAGEADESLDFIITAHVIEHLIDPIGSIAHAMRVLKPAGRYLLIVPDMAHTWDKDRPETTIEHVLADYHDGGIGTLKQAYREHLSFVHPIYGGERLTPQDIETQILGDIEARPDIHFHAWTGAGFRRILAAISSTLGFVVLCQMFVVNENIFVLEKQP